jgi:rubrerythrin
LPFLTSSAIIFKKINRKEIFMGMKTEENLKEAFAGESQANRKYLAFAKKAEEEGYRQVAKLFRAAAEAETVHAHNHLRVLKGIYSTRENIQEAINGETHEYKKMYPEMIEKAKAEKDNEAYQTFHFANEVEKIHAALYSKALENLGKNEVLDYYVCPVCGNTVEKAPPEKCPICGTLGKRFIKIA